MDDDKTHRHDHGLDSDHDQKEAHIKDNWSGTNGLVKAARVSRRDSLEPAKTTDRQRVNRKSFHSNPRHSQEHHQR